MIIHNNSHYSVKSKCVSQSDTLTLALSFENYLLCEAMLRVLITCSSVLHINTSPGYKSASVTRTLAYSTAVKYNNLNIQAHEEKCLM
jgi:hypothetical protein